MIRPSTIAITLILATAINCGVLIAARAQEAESRIVKPAQVWILFASAAHNNSVQHLTTAFYIDIDVRRALAKCEIERKQIADGFAKAKFTPIIEPKCSVEKPWTWID